ncbi:MAG TPA: peptidylprolyl isomerase [Ilumatobacteraceae bacterium]|nr:peptidylprolyl isomerase [Ilumatobacteraceae bacterium]
MARRRHLVIALVAGLLIAACGGDDDAAPVTEPATVDTAAVDTATGDPATGDTATGAGVECPPVEGTAEPVRQFAGPPPDCLTAGVTYDAIVTTNKGEFTIELDVEQGPVAANNFVFLARNRYFDDTPCHRIIPNFVVQCGDPTGTGTGGPGYTIVDEPPAPGQYQLGSIAMAKTPAPDSAGSQFFIVIGSDGAALPPEYALFGQVVEGLDSTVAEMAAAGTPGQGTPSERITIESVRIVER